MPTRRTLIAIAAFHTISIVSATSNAAPPPLEPQDDTFEDQPHWTPWISDETGYAASCGWTSQAINGFACSGHYCDWVSLLCAPMHNAAYGPAYYPTFSEEWDGLVTFRPGWYNQDQKNYEVCNWGTSTPGVLTGIGCSGAYCDNITLICSTPSLGIDHHPTFSDCAWTSSWFSEEQ